MFESKSKYKINDHPYLVSTCYFKGRDYLVKMNISNKKTLEMKITDKHTSEDWFCSYDASYIENLTRKTGNYKQFSIFVAMLKSGLMKTSESVSLDLLTFNDLEILTTKRIMSHAIPNPPEPAAVSNRRYLILIYTVEFDRVHYPLPMDYCGPPDSQVLLATIRRLEQEVSQLQSQLDSNERTGYEELTLQVASLEKRVLEVNQENEKLRREVLRLNDQLATKNNKVPQKFVEAFQNSIHKLEEQVKQQRLAMKQHLDQFQSDRAKLNAQVEEYKSIEKNLLQELESLQKRQRPPVQQTRQSRFDSFDKKTQKNTVDNQPCISTHRKATLFDGCPRRITAEPRKLSSRRSRRRSSSSDSSLGRPKREISPRRLLKDKSSSVESIHHRDKGNYSKRKACSPSGDFSSSSSSSFVKSKTNNRKLPKKSKSKDSRNDVKITELERRVNALQELLEKDFSIS